MLKQVVDTCEITTAFGCDIEVYFDFYHPLYTLLTTSYL